MNFLTDDSWLGRLFSLVADVVTLHVLWIVCSLPIFTIGASTTALYYCFMKRIRKNEGYITKNYFSSFKANFRQATILWLGLVLVGLVLWTDLRIGLSLSGIMGTCILFGSALFLIPFVLILLYIFPVQAKFENPIIKNLKNALLMGIANLGWTLLLFFINATFLLMFLFSRAFLGLFLLCGVGLYGYLTANLYVFIFRKYLPEELEEAENAFETRRKY